MLIPVHFLMCIIIHKSKINNDLDDLSKQNVLIFLGYLLFILLGFIGRNDFIYIISIVLRMINCFPFIW